MRSRLSHVLLFVFAFFRGSSLARAQDKKDVVVQPPPAVVVVQPQMVTIYLHYFFPNYCHGYCIGYTMDVPVQVPVGDAKYYVEPAYGPATAAPAFLGDPHVPIVTGH